MIDEGAFKSALGRWATGVTVVTTRMGNQVHGMTVTAFSSVSLSPPLVLICARERSYTSELIKQSKLFAVNVLAAGQEHISDRFAGRHVGNTDRFEAIEHEPGRLGCPVIAQAVAVLECTVHSVLDVGDHIIFVGAVEHAADSDVDPLLYYRNDYRKIIFGRRQASRKESPT